MTLGGLLQALKEGNVCLEIIEFVRMLSNRVRLNEDSCHDSMIVMKHFNNQDQRLFWTVENLSNWDGSIYTLELKFWDILPMKETPNMVEKLEDNVFLKCNADYMGPVEYSIGEHLGDGLSKCNVDKDPETVLEGDAENNFAMFIGGAKKGQ